MSNLDLSMDLSDIRLEDVAAWPLIARVIFIGFTCLLLMLALYFFDNRNQLTVLDRIQKEEVKIKQIFESKQQQVANLAQYHQQLSEVKALLGQLLMQLPNQTEVPGLLEDISAIGHANGLKFTLFKPLPEVQHDFYAELPISIAMRGTYHQLAAFISEVSALDRIVTVDDFMVKWASGAGPKDNRQSSSEDLQVELIAKTYRYIDRTTS